MPHPHEQLLRTNYDAFSQGDVSPMVSSFADDIEWHVSGESPVAGDYSGKGEVLEFFSKMMELYRGTLQLEVVDVLANDDVGIVITKESAEYGGKPLEYSGVHHWQFRQGKLARFENYTDDTYSEFWAAAA
jgi:ketosteroid isomerase-like protein